MHFARSTSCNGNNHTDLPSSMYAYQALVGRHLLFLNAYDAAAIWYYQLKRMDLRCSAHHQSLLHPLPTHHCARANADQSSTSSAPSHQVESRVRITLCMISVPADLLVCLAGVVSTMPLLSLALIWSGPHPVSRLDSIPRVLGFVTCLVLSQPLAVNVWRYGTVILDLEVFFFFCLGERKGMHHAP